MSDAIKPVDPIEASTSWAIRDATHEPVAIDLIRLTRSGGRYTSFTVCGREMNRVALAEIARACADILSATDEKKQP